jgi:translation initiation factor IF-3
MQVLTLSEARRAAEGFGLDLVEVNARTDPPVAR